jgi:Histidine kinase
MWEMPYTCFFILVLSPSWNQTIWFGLLCGGFVFLVTCVACHLRVRTVRMSLDQRWTERTRVARELQDTMLQTIQGSKFVVDAVLEKADDAVQMRLTLERLSSWLGQATQEGQAAHSSLRTSTTTNAHQRPDEFLL